MILGIDVDNNLKIILTEIISYKYIDLRKEVKELESIDVIIIDSKTEALEEKLIEYKKRDLKIIALVGENDTREMRRLFLSNLVDDCIVRKDIFELEEYIQQLEKKDIKITAFYLFDSFKRGIYNFSEINYITYSSISRRTEFHLVNSEIFDIKKNFSEVEEKITHTNIFYKLDRGTIINLNLIEVLDFKEEIIIFKNKEFIYTSKSKLKELEDKCNLMRNKMVLGI
ncbi:LytTR family transcriptional regulator DNA-binding domain-containing protein [Cetobacterium somerae]|uniref:LytTR family transcriptional regulator DNA-binding domain-containing protein n=1 Tax=Cetobacterium sp. NK01 TaxID=2993530 RepID=UPI002116906A|nr:LytTR family transcriptional regulator DNA-binding domain-containing protein [Cetobacterium sp. NK01]MCQ8213024.1 LytTR family transcriptional regulator DNA-binding domain-containing protein [Cetobacterium sp. NK01]